MDIANVITEPESTPAGSLAYAEELCRTVDASPSPYHAVATLSARLLAEGFIELDLTRSWTTLPERGFVTRDGSLFAWVGDSGPITSFRLVGAHTDSPGFRVKANPDVTSVGAALLGFEVYGGPLFNSWLDRDLGIAGRIGVRGIDGPAVRLVRDDRAVLRFPQLAIHLDRDVNSRGLVLDPQQHLRGLWALDAPTATSFGSHLAHLAGIDAADVAWWDIMPFDLAPACTAGRDDEMVSSARLDNLVSCLAGVTALSAATPPAGRLAVVALFDHEEVGSTSATGAAGGLLHILLERLHAAAGGTRASFLEALARSHGVSADMAHATHPNYPERHDPAHRVVLGGGPVVKANAQQRYATDTHSVTPFLEACEAAKSPVQRFVSNSSMPCGSTIGPVTAAGLAIPIVDVGVAQLAMHSVRELCGTVDLLHLARSLHRYLSAS